MFRLKHVVQREFNVVQSNTRFYMTHSDWLEFMALHGISQHALIPTLGCNFNLSNTQIVENEKLFNASKEFHISDYFHLGIFSVNSPPHSKRGSFNSPPLSAMSFSCS